MDKLITEVEQKLFDHKPHTMNYETEKSVSFSQYSTWGKCPYAWYLQYAKGLAPYRATIHTVFGSAMHETIQEYLNILYNQSRDAVDKFELIDHFQNAFKKSYSQEYEKSQVHFSNAEEMAEFFDDGVEILNWFSKNNEKYFLTKNTILLGIELPLIVQLKEGLYLKGFVDMIFYDKDEDIIYIYDIKTSGWGWGEKAKKDDSKIAQLLIYKEYFAKQYNIDIDKIDVQFFIVRRKIYENSQYEIPRVQTVKPASGKIKRKKMLESFNVFLNDCFDEKGKTIEKEHKKVPNKKNCGMCYFNDKPHLCDKKKSLEKKL